MEVPTNFKPVETSSVVSELPEFSQTPETTIINTSNSSSGSSPPQEKGTLDTNNNVNSDPSTITSSGSNRTKRRRLKMCIIRLTELSSQEREQWMLWSDQTTSTSLSNSLGTDSMSTITNDSRYNMRARPSTTGTSNRLTRRKRTVVNYAEQGNVDSSHDSDYEAKLKPPQPLDNKSYPSASQIATQRVIEMNRAIKQTSESATNSLPVATVPINKQTEDNNVFSDETTKLNVPVVLDKTVGKTSEGIDKTPTQANVVKPDATNTLSPDATNMLLLDATNASTVKGDDGMNKPETSDLDNGKPVKGVFKTKTITIRRSKDPRTFKCSVCSIRASTLKELNAHFIQNH